MADSTAAFVDSNPHPPPDSFADPLQTPPLDPLFFSSDPDHDFLYDLSLDFDFDDLDPQYFLPDADESFLLPDSAATHADFGSALPQDDGSPHDFRMHDANNHNNRADVESENSVISRDGCSDVGKYFNCSTSQTRSFDSHETIIASASAPAAVAITNSAAAAAAAASPVSSHGSGDGGSGVSETMNVPSPDSKSYPVSSTKLQGEEAKNGKSEKREKQEFSDDAIEETTRRQKCRVFETPGNSNPKDATPTTDCGGEEDEKKKARLMRNRESAQLSRQRKKHYVDELEEKVRAMNSIIADLNGRVSYFMAENATLRQQLGATPMYPPPPMPYPWMPPGAPYLAQGSKVGLVPIPRLKPQQPAGSTKPKKGETKKPGTRTKKVASVSFIGLLVFILMFGGLVPLVNVKFGGQGENVATWFGGEGHRFSDQHFPGRVLVVDGHSNTSSGKTGVGFSGDTIGKMQCQKAKNGCDNSSEQLHASLYVPRNDKLVKIDGNLIIQSVLASERTKGSHHEAAPEAKSLAIPNHLSGALAIPEGPIRGKPYHSHAEQQKAIGSRSADKLEEQFKSSAADGKLQQWFHQGLAGPILSSGVCSEVFQFDVTPSRGAIVAASSVTNLTGEGQQQRAKKHRRILHSLPVPFQATNLNVTGEQGKGINNGTQRSSSSMVVSVLVDPREVGDSEVDGVLAPKSLSRVFVVVLVDGVKYVTYSCVLPRSTPHLVRD
ncbi:bZIP transcription factor 17 [Linum grandiflorum]